MMPHVKNVCLPFSKGSALKTNLRIQGALLKGVCVCGGGEGGSKFFPFTVDPRNQILSL